MDILEWVKKQTGKIADNVKDYKFYVKHQPNFLDSSTTLILTTFSNRDEVATIPCIYKWSRIKNGLTNQVPDFKGNSFICEPADIGSIIQAQITSTDPQHPGTAILKFGPVKFDVLIKKQIEHSLAAKSAMFNVDLLQKNETKQCQIRITDDTIRITHCHSSVQYTFDYNLNEPRIEASIKQPTKVHINFNEKYQDEVKKFIHLMFGFEDLITSSRHSNQHSLEIQFPNRASKDKFLYVIKAYITRGALKNAAVIQKIEDYDFSPNANFNTMLEIESLRADLIKLARLNDKYLADKRMYHQETRKLQKEIQEIIVTYTKIAEGKCKNVEDLDQSVMELREKKDEVMEKKLHALMHENEVLRDKISFLTEGSLGKQPGAIKSQTVSDSPLAHSGKYGFVKKNHVEEVGGNHFNNLLQKLDESEVRQPSSLHDQVKSLAEEKSYLAKKLNESVIKISKLEQKLKKAQLNNTAINLGDGQHNQMSISIHQPNTSALGLGQDNKVEVEDFKKLNLKLKAENQQLRSAIPMASSRDQIIRMEASHQQAEIESESILEQVGKSSEQQSHGKSRRSELNPQSASPNVVYLRKRVQELEEENCRLKDQIQMLSIEKDVINKQKMSIQAKYKKKMSEVLNENSMHRRNQDALNRSQNLSMEMDQYNEEQCELLKEQNEILSKENEKLSKICEKYLAQAKQVPKLMEEIMALKNAKQNSKQPILDESNQSPDAFIQNH